MFLVDRDRNLDFQLQNRHWRGWRSAVPEVGLRNWERGRFAYCVIYFLHCISPTFSLWQPLFRLILRSTAVFFPLNSCKVCFTRFTRASFSFSVCAFLVDRTLSHSLDNILRVSRYPLTTRLPLGLWPLCLVLFVLNNPCNARDLYLLIIFFMDLFIFKLKMLSSQFFNNKL